MAQPRDVLGSWSCTEEGSPMTYPLGYSRDAINRDLQSKGMPYSVGTTSNYADSLILGNASSHLIPWTASVPDGSKGPFEVKAAFAQSGSSTEGKTMLAYHCTTSSQSTSGPATINAVLAFITANDTLWQWPNVLPAAIYTGDGSNASEYASLNPAQGLNTLTMVEGGNDRAYDSPPVDDSTQGCLITQTRVPTFIFVLVAIAALAVVLMSAYLLLLTVRLGIIFRRTENADDEALSTPVP
ncbi:uncharacterized protein PAC_07852 [Phialocephala subalpina]|uniref:Uncharacterized protein n=1 Tax=Phialocephala subalpina TaxID=576137 RepID=A0A1L7WYW8_9HELO|nr:uncharacterized protein PAC_07852 [Phialocephala subalpina]